MNKEHLTIKGLSRIIALKANMNLGLSEELLVAFKNVIPEDRPQVTNQTIQDVNWFVNCGHVYKKKRGSIHFMVTKFSDITEKLIPLLQNYFTIGEKHKDFHDFCQVSYMIKEKEHLTKNGLFRYATKLIK